ncbi:hypothetical protein AGMMS49587_08680 [Spirochaetia bacterium]|nr:hypothetical protein AGMMS49587_08680 [Spirochaetia bacterium]
MSVNHTPSAVLCPIKRAARKIHAQLGGGLLTGVYLDALEAWFTGGTFLSLCGPGCIEYPLRGQNSLVPHEVEFPAG